jgi:hypothetical protein
MNNELESCKKFIEGYFPFIPSTSLPLTTVTDNLIALYPDYAGEEHKTIVACNPVTKLFTAIALVYPYKNYWSWKLALRGAPCPTVSAAVQSLYHATQTALYRLTGAYIEIRDCKMS